ncbi:MAG: ATP-binding protein [Quadrisphaera sp.]
MTTTSAAALVLLCGCSFSGKSTAAAVLRDGLGAEVVSLDAINAERGLDGGRGIAVQEWVRTNDEARTRAAALLRGGRVVVVDDTASLRFLRDAWREVAARAGARFVLVHLDVPHAVLRARVAANRASGRRSDVTDAVLEEHLASFEPPTPEEAALVVVPDDDGGQLLARVRSALAIRVK